MKLLVQARKDGYNVLYPKPTPTEFFQFAGDIRRIDNNSGNFLGKYIYSIALASNGCIFTKHVIVQDVQREGLGNVGFSVFIPNVKKLSGFNVKTLLDELLKTYCEKYCPDYYLVNKQEDWRLFESIANQYDNRLGDPLPYEVVNYQQGTGEAAFVYYTFESELSNYFDAPYQEEYSEYKQVFFVEKRLENTLENPLNAIRHDSMANLTDKIKLSKSKELNIYAYDNGNNVTNFKIRVIDKVIQENNPKLIFENDEIKKIWNIFVEHIDYEIYKFDYYPAKDGNIHNAKLKKRQYFGGGAQVGNTQKENKYLIKIDIIKGYRSFKGRRIEEYELVYGNPDFKCDVRSGYKFKGWSFKNNSNNGYYEAVFEELWYHKIPIWAWILIVFLIIVFFSVFSYNNWKDDSIRVKSEKLLAITNEINSYVDGIELNKDKLEKFKTFYCDIKSNDESNKIDNNLLQNILHFGSNSTEVHEEESHSLPDYCNRINNAIDLRTAINKGDIDNLKDLKYYSEQQKQFKNSIDHIDDKFKNQIRDTLNSREVSNMNLNELAVLILTVQEELKEQEQNNIKDIVQHEESIDESKHLRNDQSPNKSQQKIINGSLEIEFWALVKKTETPQKNDYDILLEKYNQQGRYGLSNPSVVERDIISFLKKICKKSDTFKPYAKDIPSIDRQKAKTITDLRKLLEETE
jgi:hypothetical protein